jgi:hypothetical protein
MKLLINLMQYYIILSLLPGCAGTEITNPLMIDILKSQTALKVRSETIETLTEEYSLYSYSGFGNITLRFGSNRIIPEFEKILYDPSDSVLFMQGTVYIEKQKQTNNNSITVKDIYPNTQIIVGNIIKLPENYDDEGKINIHYNYLVGRNGKFSLALKVNKQRSIIFAPREEYEGNGEYDYTPIYSVNIYDICKFNNIKDSSSYK